MSASRITTQMPLPPPRAFHLLDGTGPVGWIDGNRVEFTGFADPAEAAAAAWVAHVGLERRRAKSQREAVPYLESPALILVRSGGYEWIAAAGKRLARLVRPSLQDRPLHSNEAARVSARWFGIEIAFPPDASELTIDSSAHVIYLALRRSGVPWSIRPHGLVLAPALAALRAKEPRIALRSGAARLTATQGLEVENALIR